MKKDVCVKVVAGPNPGLAIKDLEIVRLNGNKSPVPESGSTTFVATFKLVLTEIGYHKSRDDEPVKTKGNPDAVLIEVRKDGNVTSALESNSHDSEVAEFLREHFDFDWELNGHASNLPILEKAVDAHDKELLQYPWCCVLDASGIRTQIFDLDCKIRHRSETHVQSGDPKRLSSGLLPYHIEVDSSVTDSELVGTKFRIPVILDKIGHAFLVFEYEPPTKPNDGPQDGKKKGSPGDSSSHNHDKHA